MAGNSEIGRLALLLTANIAEFDKAMSAASKSAAGMQKSTGGAFAGVGASARQMGVLVAGAAAAVGVAIAGIGVAAVKSAASFEKSMSGIKAVSGATGEEMKQLSGLALQLGKDTSFSAGEAAAGIEELIKAGLSIADIMGGGAKAALDLAAAGEISVADAAEIASNAMNQFGLKGGDLAHAADLIAGAANASSLSVTDFKFSLAAVGAVAAVAGQSFDSTAQAIAVLGAAGIKGSDAGTSLKAMLMNLIPTTDKAIGVMSDLGIITKTGANQFFDATGKAKGMAEIAQVLQVAMKGLTEQQKLAALEVMFGSDAMRAAAIMAKAGAAGFNEMAAGMGKVTAASVAAERLNNVKGSLEQLQGSLETAAIAMGTAFLPGLKRVIDGMVDGVNKAVPFAQAVGEIGAALVAGEGFDALYKSLVETFGSDIAGKIAAVVDPLARLRVDILPAVVSGAQDVGKAIGEMGTAFNTATRYVKEHEAAQLALISAFSIGGGVGLVALAGKVAAGIVAVGAAAATAKAAVAGFGTSLYIASLYGLSFGTVLAGAAAPLIGFGVMLAAGVVAPLAAFVTNASGFRDTILNITAIIALKMNEVGHNVGQAIRGMSQSMHNFIADALDGAAKFAQHIPVIGESMAKSMREGAATARETATRLGQALKDEELSYAQAQEKVLQFVDESRAGWDKLTGTAQQGARDLGASNGDVARSYETLGPLVDTALERLNASVTKSSALAQQSARETVAALAEAANQIANFGQDVIDMEKRLADANRRARAAANAAAAEPGATPGEPAPGGPRPRIVGNPNGDDDGATSPLPPLAGILGDDWRRAQAELTARAEAFAKITQDMARNDATERAREVQAISASWQANFAAQQAKDNAGIIRVWEAAVTEMQRIGNNAIALAGPAAAAAAMRGMVWDARTQRWVPHGIGGRGQGPFGPDDPDAANFVEGGQGGPSSDQQRNSGEENAYALGGVVTGPVGRPQRAIVHGGEYVLKPGQKDNIEALLSAILGALENGMTLDGHQVSRVLSPYLGESGTNAGRFGGGTGF